MEEQYRKEIAWWFAELGSESEVDNYLAFRRRAKINPRHGELQQIAL